MLIPPLERVFNLVGADVRGWYDEMPRSLRVEQEDTINLSPGRQKEAADDEKSNIVDHFRSCHCLVCHSITTEGETLHRLRSGILTTLWIPRVMPAVPLGSIQGYIVVIEQSEKVGTTIG